MKRNHFFLLIGAILALLAMTAFVWESTPPEYIPQIRQPSGFISQETLTKPRVKIGVITPFAHDVSKIGTNCEKGIEFALTHLNESPIQYDVIYEYNAANAADAAKKLINTDHVNVLIACSLNTGIPAMPFAQSAGVFMLTIAGSSLTLLPDSFYGFVHLTPPTQQSKKILDIVQKNPGRRILLLTQNTPEFTHMEHVINTTLSKEGYAVLSQRISSDQLARDMVQTAQEQKADMWIILADPSLLTAIVDDMNQRQLKIPYTAVETPSDMEHKMIFEGIPYTDIFEGNPALLAEYKNKYETQNAYGALFAYDTIMIINKLYADFYSFRNRLPNTTELSNGLMNFMGYEGAAGPITTTLNGLLERNAVIKTIQNGTPVIIEKGD